MRYWLGGLAVIGVLMIFRNRAAFSMPGMLSLSAAGLDALKKEEGWRDRVYQDMAGFATIGYGHLLKAGEAWPAAITKAEGEAILKKDISSAEASVRSAVLVPVTQGMFDALVSFVFNIGAGQFSKSTMLKKLNAGNYADAADAMLAWHYAGGKANTLTARRNRERDIFMSGIS